MSIAFASLFSFDEGIGNHRAVRLVVEQAKVLSKPDDYGPIVGHLAITPFIQRTRFATKMVLSLRCPDSGGGGVLMERYDAVTSADCPKSREFA